VIRPIFSTAISIDFFQHQEVKEPAELVLAGAPMLRRAIHARFTVSQLSHPSLLAIALPGFGRPSPAAASVIVGLGSIFPDRKLVFRPLTLAKRSRKLARKGLFARCPGSALGSTGF